MDSSEKLEQERHSLELLKEQVKRSSQLSEKMVDILTSFENRLGSLQQTILPIYNEMENLQLKKNNVEKTLFELDRVITYHDVCPQVESIILSRPNGPDGLNEYLDAMEKLLEAQVYFEKNNPQSVELENVSSLFKSGGDTIQREFKELLLKYSNPVQPAILLDIATNDEELLTDDSSSVSSINHFPENVSSDLIRLADWLISQSRDEYMNVYARVRANTLTKSISTLKEYQKAGSAGSIHMAVGQTMGSPVIKTKFPHKSEITVTRKTSKRIQHVFERKANRMLMKASQTIGQSTGLNLGTRRPNLLENKEDVVEEQEMENYLVSVIALQRLMQAELNLMIGIIPIKHHHQVFQIIIQESLSSIVHEGENISTRAKRCIHRKEFASVFVMFPILKHLTSMKIDFERTMEGCDPTVRGQYSTIMNTFHSTGLRTLEEIIESVRSDTSMGLPRDGTVYQLTSDVVVLMEQLLEYIDSVGPLLSQVPIYNNMVPHHLPLPEKYKFLLGLYIKKVLSQLNLMLVNRSDSYSEPGVKYLFRLNNSHYVIKALQRSALLDIVSLTEPECENTYLEMIASHKKSYQQCWIKIIGYITNLDDIQLINGKPKDKDRNLIKERFAGFNKEIEEILKLQRGYTIPDIELREGLKRDNKEYILPKYNAFYDSSHLYVEDKLSRQILFGNF
ncbi:exocyst complex component 7 isoform X2 [Daktulosphaira vitifoliae]|uniref:exocyst complex component 7 isoform X2 n=1 Tax=Daktulosphaira vitifoliae TaxID=58002 RepID=UPI0021AAA991|nr:exocyst complex component 7 isoform X2 [Daktulosphaira vitifoliae]